MTGKKTSKESNEEALENEEALAALEALDKTLCEEPLSKWTSNFNLFEVLNITKTEIRHSNVLAWLLDPNENHELGGDVLRGFLKLSGYDAKDMDLSSFVVRREWRNIDILAISHKQELLLAIENKIDSDEHNDQLSRYESILNEEYPKYKKHFLFLTRDAKSPKQNKDKETWLSASYKNVKNIIEAARDNSTGLPKEVEVTLFIDNFITTVKRHIMGDKELKDKCQEIYDKHRKALGLILENRDDVQMKIYYVLKEWCEEKNSNGLIEFTGNDSKKDKLCFGTPYMSKLLPKAPKSNTYWNDKNIRYYYEILNEPDGVRVSFVLSPFNFDNLDIENQKAFIWLLNNYSTSAPYNKKKTSIETFKSNRQWLVANKRFKDHHFKIKDIIQVIDGSLDIDDSLNMEVRNGMEKLFRRVCDFQEEVKDKFKE